MPKQEKTAHDSDYYRKQAKLKTRILEETKPGANLRENPDYNAIMEAIRKEAAQSERAK